MTLEGPVSPLRRPLGVSLYFATHAACALLLALPTLSLVTGTGIGRFPEGDRLLFQPGGVLLAEVARVVAPAVSAHTASSLGSATLLGILLLLPHAALLVALSRSERQSQAAVWGRAVGHLPALLSLSGLALLAQAIVFFAALTLAGSVKESLEKTTPRSADLAYLAVVAFGLLVTLVVGLVRDLGRAAAVREWLGSKMALLTGLKTLARTPGRYLLAWGAPALAGLALVALGAVSTTALDVSRPGAWRVWMVALVHQLVAYALCWCRAFWLSASLGSNDTISVARSSVVH